MFPFVLAIALVLPTPIPGYRVQDFAGILSTSDESRLEVLSGELTRLTTAELAVVTVPSLQGLTVDEYANRLANAWGIGRRETNNGVLLLVAPTERRTRIEVGYGLEPILTDRLCGQILDQTVVPEFKKQAYGQGILAGAEAIAAVLQEHPEAARGVAGSAPGFLSTPLREARSASWLTIGVAIVLMVISILGKRFRDYPSPVFAAGLIGGVSAGAWAAVANGSLHALLRPLALLTFSEGLLLLTLAYAVRNFIRFRPRSCPQCRSRMVCLDEARDDRFLTDAARLEEKLGSVDHDVWVCSACKATEIEPRVRWSQYQVCSHCHRRTFRETSTVVVSATDCSEGEQRIDGLCSWCGYQTTRNEAIPRRSSGDSGDSGGSGSSGGGGFSGGSSGGGGASRGW